MKIKKHTAKVLFFSTISILFVWGVLLRSPEVLSGNFLFGHDHGRDYLAAYNIVENRKMTLIGAEAGSGVAGINGIFHGPGYFYLMSLAYIIFNGDPFVGQLFMVVFGIAALIVAGYIGYKIFGKIGSILFLFFMAVSPLIVSQSRFIWSSHPITPFVLLALYFVYKIPENPRVFAPLAVFISGFTYHSQLGVAIPLTLSVLLSIPLVYKIRDIRVYIYAIVAFCLAYLPMFIFEARHGYMAMKSAWNYAANGASSSGSLFDVKGLGLHLIDYWNNFANTFTFEFGWVSNHIQKIVLHITIPFVLIGLMQSREKIHRKFISFLLLVIVITYAGYLLLNNRVWDYYLTHIRLAYMFLFTYGLLFFIQLKKYLLVKYIGLAVAAVFLLSLSTGSVFRMYVTYTIDVKEKNTYYKILGKKEILDTIYADAKGQPFSALVYMMSVYTHPYDYLFKTYGKKKYGYVPSNEKKGLTYLIIEPDTDLPWRANGWLETVVQGGKTIWVKTLLNGLILEKREYPL